MEVSDSPVIPLDIYMGMMIELESLRVFVQENLEEIGDLPQMRETLKDGLLFLLSMHRASVEKIKAQQIIWWLYWEGTENKCWSELPKKLWFDHATSSVLLHGFKRLHNFVYGILKEINEAKDYIEWEDTLTMKINNLASMQKELELIFEAGKSIYEEEENNTLQKVRREAQRLKKEADYANSSASESKQKLEDARLEHKKDTRALKNQHRLEVEELKGKLKSLEDARRNETEKLKTQLRDLNKLHENDTTELRRKDIEVNRSTKEVKDLQLKNSRLMTRNSCLDAQKSSLEKQIEKLKKKNAELQTRLELPVNVFLKNNCDLEFKIEKLKSKLKQQEDYLTEKVMREDEIELLTKKYNCLISDIGSIHQEEKKIRNKEMARKGKLCLDMQEQIADLKSDNHELNTYIESLEAKNKLLTDSSEDSELRIQRLEMDRAELLKQVQKLKNRIQKTFSK